MGSRTVNGVHEQQRNKYGCPKKLNDSYADNNGCFYLPGTFTDQRGSFELPKTSMLASRSSSGISGRSMSYNDQQGVAQRLHGSHAGACRI
ncbi:hypothetical protein DPMN_118147 [Dreissena polymorpha]|uniref:Uncharacterized protein n=1 Tax=Dreissena polymorpha TaxID=45954 RepID=A0A9D4GJM7_DREPO|nr:hypothetical protein DPMN_118147 [Dreissena polymorpha]